MARRAPGAQGQDQPAPGDAGGAGSGQGQGGPASPFDDEAPEAFDMDEGNRPEPTEAPEGLAQGRLAQARRRGLEDSQFECPPLQGRGAGALEKLVGNLAESGMLVGEGPGGAAEGGRDVGIETLLKERNQFVPDPITQERCVVIGRIGPIRKSLGDQVRDDGGAPRIQEGPKQIPIPGFHGGKTEGAAPPNQTHENGLRLIIEGMTEHDGARVLLPGHAPEEGVPGQSRRFLQPPVLKGLGWGTFAAGPEPDFEAITKLLAKLGVGAGVRPDGMIEMGNDHADPGFFRGSKKRVEQGH